MKKSGFILKYKHPLTLKSDSEGTLKTTLNGFILLFSTSAKIGK